MSSRKLVVVLMAAALTLMVTAAAAAPPRVDLEGARKLIEGLGRPEKIAVSPEDFFVNEHINITGPKAFKPGSVIVRLETGITAKAIEAGLEMVLTKFGGAVKSTLDMDNRAEGMQAMADSTLRFAFLQFAEDADVFAIAAELDKLPGVVYAEPDYKFYPDIVTLPPTDTYFAAGYQYYLLNEGQQYVHIAGYQGTAGADIKALPAWEYALYDFGLDASSVVVGVIDQGVCFWIPELTPNMWVNQAEFDGIEGVDDDGNGFVDDVYGYNFYHDLGINDYASGYRPFMGDAHGTHVAGTISSAWNGQGVAGATRNAKIMSIKFLGPDGGYTSDAIRSVNYAAMMGADLTNNSWGGGEPSKALADAIRASGKLFIAAAGNDGNNNDFFGHYPSSYANKNSPYYCANIISVAATDANDKLSAYSCYGVDSVHVAAPGTWILAPVPRATSPYYTYSWYVGTSMATPLVSSVAAMVIAQDKMHPGYSLPQYIDPNPLGQWDTVKEVVLNSAEKKAQLNGLVSTGARVSMYNALTWQRLPSVSSIDASVNFSNTAPVTVQLTVNLDAGAAASVTTIEHRWRLMKIDAWWEPTDMGISVTSTSTTASLTIPDYGNYQVKYEMYDLLNDVVVTTSYKPILVAEPEAVILVLDDQWHGWEQMSWYDEIAFILNGIPYYYATLPMDIPTNIPNIVFWTTTYTYFGVINEEDAQWIINYLRDGGRLFLASYEMLNMLDGYYGESAFHPDTAAELLEMLKIKDYILDHTYAMTGTVPWYEDMANVVGDSIIWANGLHLDLEYGLWSDYMYNFGDAVTDFGPGAYPILLSLNGGAIDEPDRAAYGISYAGDDYRLIFLGVPLEALQGYDFDNWYYGQPYTGDLMNFIDFIWYSYEFLMGEGPDRLTAWLEAPQTGGTFSNPLNIEWGIMDFEGTNHGARLWYRNGTGSTPWEPVTLFVPGEDFEYLWNTANKLVGSGYEVKLQVFDAADPSRVAYDFEGPFSIWPANDEEGARAGVDRDAEAITFFVNAKKPGTLYVYDLSGILIFSRAVPEGMSEVHWDMMVNGLRIARGLYAFRVVYNDGSASKTGRVLINF